jgi:hypothetical protein
VEPAALLKSSSYFGFVLCSARALEMTAALHEAQCRGEYTRSTYCFRWMMHLNVKWDFVFEQNVAE